MRVLIGGGSGFIGQQLIKTLQKAGHEALCVSRGSPSKTNVDFITWNDLIKNGLPECQAVVNLAGESFISPRKRWNEEFKDAVYSSRVDITHQLVRAIHEAKTKPKVWICSSGVGYYKGSPTAEYTEDSPGGDHSWIARLCTDWEHAAQIPAQLGVRHVTMRIGLVLGTYGGVMQSLYLPFYFGLGGNLGSGKQWFPWIHVEDIANIIMFAIENNKVTGVLNAVAPAQNTNAEFTSTLAKVMWRPAIFPVPSFVINAVYGAERGEVMLEGPKVIPKRTLELGYKYKYGDLKSALEECAQFPALKAYRNRELRA